MNARQNSDWSSEQLGSEGYSVTGIDASWLDAYNQSSPETEVPKLNAGIANHHQHHNPGSVDLALLQQTRTDRTKTARSSHRVVQQRYRDNLNTSIEQLHSLVVFTNAHSLNVDSPNDSIESEDLSSLSKTAIVSRAIAQIKQASADAQRLTEEISMLDQQMLEVGRPGKCWTCLYMACAGSNYNLIPQQEMLLS